MEFKRWVVVGILFLICSNLWFIHQKLHYQNQYEISRNNEKAYESENSALKENAKIFQLTIDDLNNSKDSVVQEMMKVKKDMGIKDKNLYSIHYIKSTITKTDTVTFKDTIFKEMLIPLDTCITNEWYKLKLSLAYPNVIKVTPTFISDQYIVTSWKKDYVASPKKYWFQRIFQKRKKELEVEVKDKNPYVKVNTQKIVKVLE